MVNGLPDARLEGIFFMFGGIPNTIFESQVLVHVRNMQQVGIDMEVWTFAGSSWEYRAALDALPRIENNFPTIKVRVFRGVRPALPSSEWLNALLLLWRMWRLGAKPDFVRARTEYPTVVAAIAKRMKGFTLIWDDRGDSISEFRENIPNLTGLRRLQAPFKERTILRWLNIARRDCDAALFVSNELWRLDRGGLPEDKALIVPCVADEELFYSDADLRREMRTSLGYGPEDTVVLYSGSTASYQCVPETIELMEAALYGNPSIKVLIVTPDEKRFEGLLSTDLRDRVSIFSATLRDMNGYLNAADFGVLLRKSDGVNKVASPVKFAEYSLAGLTVIATDAVSQVNEFGRSLGNIVSKEEFTEVYVSLNQKPSRRRKISEMAKILLGRRSYIDRLVSFYESLN